MLLFMLILSRLLSKFGEPNFRLLVGAPKANDPLQRTVRTPGVLLRCPLDGPSLRCDEVVVDTSGKAVNH